jgi:hypothetical protein
LAVARGWVLVGLAEDKTSLEDIFVRLTAHDVVAPEPEQPEPEPLEAAEHSSPAGDEEGEEQ